MAKSKIPMLKPRVATIPDRLSGPPRAKAKRMRGKGLQNRRWKLWKASPHCAHCSRLTAFPDGFQLDHRIAMMNGGTDEDANLQVLCIECHLAKTAQDHRG